MADIELNGVDLSTYGFVAQKPGDLLSSPQLSYDPIKLATRPGAKAGLRTTGTRPFTISGIQISTSLASAKSNLDKLMNIATKQQPSTVIFAWSTDRRLVAECLGVKVEPTGPAFAQFKYNINIMFDAPDPPFWQATTQDSGVNPIVMGTAPVRPQILLGAGNVNPVVSLINSTGTTVASMGFTITLSSSQYLAIDMDKMTVYLNDSSSGAWNTGTNMSTAWTSGDFWEVLPEYYNYAASSWPTWSAGGGPGIAQIYYYRQWY